MEVIRSSETSFHIQTTRRYIRDDGSIQLSGCVKYCEFPDCVSYVNNCQLIYGDGCETEVLLFPFFSHVYFKFREFSIQRVTAVF
jgi:hypothetical protein